MLNYYVEAKDAIAPIIDLAHELDYRKRLPAIYVAMVAYLVMVEERHSEEKTRWYLTEARRLALEEKDYLSLGNVYFYEAHAHVYNCEFAEGESCFLRLVEMSEAAGNVTGIVIAKYNIAVWIYAQDGRIDEALTCSQEVVQLALQADDLYLKGGAYGVRGYAFYLKGLLPEAEDEITLAIELNRKTDYSGGLIGNFMQLGLLRYEMCQYREAQRCCDDLLAVYDRVRLWPSYARFAQILKVAAGVRGYLNPALNEVLNFDLQEIRLTLFQGAVAQTMAEIFLHIDDAHMDEAEAWIRKAIETDEKNRMPWDLAKDYALYAEFFKKKGDSARTRENLLTAIGIFRQCGADGWVTKYEEELARL
jgi:tetratricopeptide (TPR) repeat protein